jgi:hypothetical protein
MPEGPVEALLFFDSSDRGVSASVILRPPAMISCLPKIWRQSFLRMVVPPRLPAAGDHRKKNAFVRREPDRVTWPRNPPPKVVSLGASPPHWGLSRKNAFFTRLWLPWRRSRLVLKQCHCTHNWSLSTSRLGMTRSSLQRSLGPDCNR